MFGVHRLVTTALLMLVVSRPSLAQQDDGIMELERFRQSSKPQTFADLKPSDIPNEDNAAWWLDRAATGRVAIDTALAIRFQYDASCDEEFIAAWKEIVAQHPETYSYLRKAAEASDYAPDRDYTVTSFEAFKSQLDSGIHRSVARVFMYQSSVEFAEGRTEDAVRSALAILKFSRHKNLAYGINGYLDRNVVATIGLASLNPVIQSGKSLKPETLKAIREALKQHDTLDDYQNCFDSERVIGIHMLKDQGIASAAFRVEGYLKTIRAIQENANLTIADRRELLESPEEFGVTGMMIYPAAQMTRDSAHRKLTLVRCLRLMVELNLQMDDQPDWVDIELPESAKTDPVTGKPLVFKKVVGGWLVYGAGRDQVDDGGEVERDLDFGFQPFPDKS